MMLGAAPIRSRQLRPAAIRVRGAPDADAQHPDRAAPPDFRGLTLMLRGRAGVSARAVQTWEAGLNYPSALSLQRMIALFLARGAFTAGRELEEAMALWT